MSSWTHRVVRIFTDYV